MPAPYTFAFGGGLDLSSAALAVPPGRLVAALNYEPLAEGYGRVQGFERFDGSTLPSVASFWTLAFDQGGSPIADGDTVAGVSSGATATVVMAPQGFTGSWDATTASGTLVLGGVTGTFEDGELLHVGGFPRARVNGIAVENPAAPASYRLAVQAWRRAGTMKVPGIGPVRGVAWLDGVLYAWRDQNTETARMFRATATGWQIVASSYVLAFESGELEPSAGEAISKGAATATIRYVVRQDGSWSEGTAQGYLVISDRTASFTPGDLRNDEGDKIATLTGESLVTFNAGGRYDVLNHNFYGASNLRALYGAYGEGPGFAYDGTVVAPIQTGMADDRPTRVSDVAEHLMFAFRGGSVQFSSPGEPFGWSPVIGAGEIGLGTEITNFIPASSSATVITGSEKIAVLQGRDIDSFQLDVLTDEAGAEAWSAAKVGTTIYVDQRGLRALNATSAFGNFKTGTLSEPFESYFRAKRAAGARLVASYVVKAKSQYRLIWNDGTGLAVFMGRKQAEALPYSLGDMRPFCATTAEMGDGREAIFIGAEDGYVYRMDSGTSFDGEQIPFFAMTPFNHLGAARREKRYHGFSLELQAVDDASLSVLAQFNYGDGTTPNSGSGDFSILGSGGTLLVQGGGGIWDVSLWNCFNWSAGFEGSAYVDIDGIGRNVSFVIGGRAGLLEEPHVLQAYTITATPLRMVRGA
ncbi:hypothetical protein [Sphingomonas sp.]|uniref:hypothetical protein n=1 Tax=Sphingomonas sp. TaxID=28214 RepID=UPI00307E87F7